jgi:hypothetical protein
MDTVYDWVTLAIFAGLIVLFLQRATSEHAEKDASLFYYLIAGAGCAVADYLGNHDQGLLAWLLLGATAGFILYFLKPFARPSQS